MSCCLYLVCWLGCWLGGFRPVMLSVCGIVGFTVLLCIACWWVAVV